jgi:hypothetical protein
MLSLVYFYIANAYTSCRYLYVQTAIRHAPHRHRSILDVLMLTWKIDNNARHLCYSTARQQSCSSSLPRPRDPSTTGRSPSPGILAPGTPAAIHQSHPRLCWFLHFAAQHAAAERAANAHLVAECFFRVPLACSRPLRPLFLKPWQY